MKQKEYNFIAGAIFLVIAIFHLFRIILKVPVTMAGNTIPLELSWIAFILSFYLAYKGLILSQKK